MSNYYNPVKIIKTNNWVDELNSSILKLDILNPIIVTSHGNRKRLKLDSKFNSDSIYSDVGSNPNFDECNNALEFCCDRNFDGVIAFRGGSVMDLAKVIMAYLSLGEMDITKLISYKEEYTKNIPSIFFPTTHGTASEVTMWGTIWDMDEKKKYSISHPSLYPTIAVLDGSLTLTLPLSISIVTSMDALSHSFESIWNKNANKISTDFAITAICSIIENITKLKNNPLSLENRNNLLEASDIAGLAFSNTETAAAHSISYPLTINYNIPHGIACSMPLLSLIKINKNAIIDELDQILLNLKFTNINDLIDIIRKIPEDIVKFNLNEWGVKESELPNLVKQSFTKDRIENNIIDLTIQDIEKILIDIF